MQSIAVNLHTHPLTLSGNVRPMKVKSIAVNLHPHPLTLSGNATYHRLVDIIDIQLGDHVLFHCSVKAHTGTTDECMQ